MTLDSQTANAIKSGGHVDFAYYISGGSDLDHTYRFTNRSDVTKRVRSVVDGPLNYGFSSWFSWEVEAVGYDSQSTTLFSVSSGLVPIPSSCS